MLNKRRILIERTNHICTYCKSNTCIHFQAFDLCSQNDCVQVCEANNLDDMIYYHPNPKDIFLLKEDTFHCFQLNNGNWFCNSCSLKCKEYLKLKIVLDKVTPDTSIKKVEYNIISTRSIPFSLDENQIKIYNHQLRHGINLPVNIYPEKDRCDNGFNFNKEEQLKLEKVGVVIYMENDVNEFKEHKGKYTYSTDMIYIRIISVTLNI